MFQYGFEGLSLHVCHRVMADAYRPYLLRCKILFSKKDYSFARQAIPGIIQSLATTLDNVLLLFIDEDLKQYRATHGISPQKLKVMSSEDSKQALDAYFQRLDSEGFVTHFLSGKCKDLNFSREAEREYLLPPEVRVNHHATVIDIIAIQFIANMELMLRRVSEDRPLILNAICASNSVPIPPQPHNLKLTAAKLVGSDAHKFGKQVMKLAFQYSAGPILIQEELIYKPSSIAIETAIAGNMPLLRRIDSSYLLRESCFELINNILPGEIKLPTYLMIPRGQDDTPAQAVNAYGYKQVLKCEPYPEFDTSFVLANFLPAEVEILKGFVEDLWKSQANYRRELFLKIQSLESENEQYKKTSFTDQEVVFLKALLNSSGQQLLSAKFVFGLTAMTTEYLSRIQPADRDRQVEEFQNQVGRYVLEMIIESVTTCPFEKIEQYDCVTTKLRDLEIFSKQCGMLFAAFYVLKIGDMHAENVLATCVANGKQIIPIDIENAFDPIINPGNIAAIGSLWKEAGGFSILSQAPINFSVLLGIEGVLKGKAPIPCRNLLYLLTKRGESKELQCVAPILEDFREGAELTLNCIMANKDRLINWLHQPYVQNCLIRVLPFNTTSLQSFRSGAFLRPNVTMEIDSSPDQWLDDFATKENHEELSTTVLLTPRFYAASKPYPFREALSHSVPIYYMRANSIQLLDGNGELVNLDAQDREHLEKEIENRIGRRADGTSVNWRQVLLTLDGQTRYYTITPVEAVVRSLTALNDQVVSKVIEFVEERARKQGIMLRKEEVRNTYFPEEIVAGAAVFEVRSPGIEPH